MQTHEATRFIVNVTTPDGELLDRMAVTVPASRTPLVQHPSAMIRDVIERHFDIEETND
jgi:hypothetical protein